MRDRRRIGWRGRVSAAMAASLAVAMLSACTEDPPVSVGVQDSPGTGGTVRILTAQPGFATLDPQRIFVTTEANVSKLITRTLTTFRAAPGKEGGELVGDLATDTGRPNEDNTAWDFTLRDGIKWDNGKSVTCEDVRYGVLRNFDAANEEDAVITGGPPYPKQWLDVPDDYRGPRVDGIDDVGGVTCSDDKTIHFDLKEPAGTFPYATAMSAFSPVPEAADTWADYGLAPMSTGPYRLTEYRPAEDGGQGTAVFERNPYWDSRIDPVRRAAPDRIVWEFGVDPQYAAQQIVADNPEFSNAVMYDNIPSNFIQQVINDDQLSRQLVNGATSTVRYMAINTATVTDVDCRRALAYAFNKRKYLDVLGGELFGTYATTMLAPDDPAHKDFDTYGLANKPDGDMDKARELLDTTDCPDSLALDVAGSDLGRRYADTVVTTYGRLGITVKVHEFSPDTYYDEIARPSAQHDLVLAAWAPDWPGGSGVIPALFSGELILDNANSNFSLLDDADVNGAIEVALDETDEAASYSLWGDLDEQIQELAAVVPINFVTVNLLCGKDVRGAFVNAQWSSVDVGSLGLATGS